MMTVFVSAILLIVATSDEATTTLLLAFVVAGTLSIFINCLALADIMGLLCVNLVPLLLMVFCDGVLPPFGVTSASVDGG